jgi:uncharacterized Zn-finger protein
MDDMVVCPYCKEEILLELDTYQFVVYGYDRREVCPYCEKTYKLSATVMFKTEEIDNE